MYDSKKASVDDAARRFERMLEERAPEARAAGEHYLDALTDLIDTFSAGPAADSRVMELDTTGELSRTEDHVAWAEQERHRVRKAMRDLR
jgi:hypothetical protein